MPGTPTRTWRGWYYRRAATRGTSAAGHGASDRQNQKRSPQEVDSQLHKEFGDRVWGVLSGEQQHPGQGPQQPGPQQQQQAGAITQDQYDGAASVIRQWKDGKLKPDDPRLLQARVIFNAYRSQSQ